MKQDVFVTEDEYLKGELISDVKHEYVKGQAYAMAGASKNHERISGNIYAEFRDRVQNEDVIEFLELK